MDRRSFISSLLGLSASAALPQRAIDFIAESAALPDAEFEAQARISLSDIIETTIRARLPELVANVNASNVLLRRLKANGNIV